MTTELTGLNEAIGVAESVGDRAFFEELLHPQFVMIRPSAADSPRTVVDLTGSIRSDLPPWDTPPPDAPRYDNLRLFWRTDDGWRLVAWVNEPAS